METVRIALANFAFPASPQDSVRLAVEAIVRASDQGAGLICFPECFVPGYRGIGKKVPPPDRAFLDGAWSTIAAAAAKADVTVVLGTERDVRRGAHVVFHPHFHEAEPGGYVPVTFADPANTFHEKAALCRAAENTCYFATVNYASEGSPTTSAVVRPDGTLLTHQPYGQDGLLVADLDLAAATGLLAARCQYP